MSSCWCRCWADVDVVVLVLVLVLVALVEIASRRTASVALKSSDTSS